MFPEGTRSPDGHVQRFRHGAARLCIELGVAAVPIGILGGVPGHAEGSVVATGRPPAGAHALRAPLFPEPRRDASGVLARMPQAVAELFDEDRTNWWEALQRAERGETPSLDGPDGPRVAEALGGHPADRASRQPEDLGVAVPRTGGEQRRTTIVEEAIRQFGREGYKGASIESIATAVGVRKQTLLYYFPKKEALLEACLRPPGSGSWRRSPPRSRARRPTGIVPRP